ncbi:hypothetical protein THAOC_31212 [Thalassiosira oceanica]|uniref:SAM domain-containing protein n=1 Tax=Thalassiosira oceanica TaxID=159749 RepID=K0RC63_THAOC|nr:hypothetical protein THAOC_31212 [Thalassiosira oceanica]|eukprot:EJK49869.1 hypothetical protein THAOC_31212 [Thalassiosira oceanica]
MKELDDANASLKAAHDERERDYEEEISKLDNAERDLLDRISKLNGLKDETAKRYGNEDASDDDIVNINAGGTIVDVKRGTLCQLKGTRLEALFSGRWEKKLQKDSSGRIFLDVNPTAFQAIVDYLNELSISAEDDPPQLPRVNEEHQHILDHQLELFGLRSSRHPESTVLNQKSHFDLIHDWLGKGDSDFKLLYRSSRDGSSPITFHSKCNSQGRTVTFIETENGLILGGYSDVSWSTPTSPYNPHRNPHRRSIGGNTSSTQSHSNEAFVFVLSGEHIAAPCKLISRDGSNIVNNSGWGPTFGRKNNISDLLVTYGNVSLNIGKSYEALPFGDAHDLSNGSFKIKDMEVFQVVEKPGNKTDNESESDNLRNKLLQVKRIDKFTDNINQGINTKWTSLQSVESKVLALEESFKTEEQLVCSLAGGSTKDIISLNVSGTRMTTMRDTLMVIEDSVLARQFDDTKWTDQGSAKRALKEWEPEDVSKWAKGIEGIPESVAESLKENKITGRELVALNIDGLKMLGIERPGTLCLLIDEINILKRANQDHVTLIEHSPYCFGLILDYLRLKHLHAQGLAKEPRLPVASDPQLSRYQKVVKYYFPGDSSKLLLG